MRKATLGEFKTCCGRPQRICWAVAEAEGRRSICPIGWKMTTSMSPPMMAISVAPSRFTHDLIATSEEFVLAWPGEDLAQATMLAGTKSGRDSDKFAACGVTPVQGEQVKGPLVAECIANLECRLAGQLTTGDHTIFAGVVVAVWVHEEPKRPLCQIGEESGYEFLMEQGMYRFGVVAR